MPSTDSISLCRGNNHILLTTTDGKCMPGACVGVCILSGEWKKSAGDVAFVCSSMQKRQYGYSESSVVAGPERNGALVLGFSADPRTPIALGSS